jgi:hypothetical protein
MSGYIAIHREIFDHPIFKAEPFTEREAWMWLISEAAWQAKRVRIGNTVFDLSRGQAAHALRFMAETWKWSVSRVRRFLERLKNDRMIDSEPTRDATLITIRNYDKFQPSRNAEETPTSTPAARARHKEEEIKNIKLDDDGEDAGKASAKPPGEPLVSQWAHDLADEIGRMCGNDPNFTPPGWFGAPMRVESWRSEGWQREIILASVSEQLARKRDGPPGKIQYFEKGIARAHAEQTAKLPQVGPIATQTIEARHAAKANTPTAGIRALRSKLAGHGGSGLRADEDRTDVRMLSQGRGQ